MLVAEDIILALQEKCEILSNIFFHKRQVYDFIYI